MDHKNVKVGMYSMQSFQVTARMLTVCTVLCTRDSELKLRGNSMRILRFLPLSLSSLFQTLLLLPHIQL